MDGVSFIEKAFVQRLQRGNASVALRQDAQAPIRGGGEEDRRRHGLRRDGQTRLLQREQHPDLLRETRPPVADIQRERLCETGACESEGHHDGRIVRDAEGASLVATCQGQEEGDGDPVHILLNPHCQRSATGRAV